jgi:hypothetical protein
MSHFSVAVFTKTKDQPIDELLAPYDEGIEVAPYVRRTKAQIIQQEKNILQKVFSGAYAEWKNDPKGYEAKCHNPGHIRFLKSLPKRMKMSDERLYQEAVKFFEKGDLTPEGDLLSTYSPKAKWDWYEIGGRWNGLLIPRAKRKDAKNPRSRNAAYVSDLDFEAMRRRKAAEIPPYEEAMENGYHEESHMRASFPTEAEYIQRATAFGTYAVVMPDGEWHAKGEMGWWGMSSETPEEDREWELGYYERFIKPAIDNHWYVTIVDCHI